MTTGRWEIKLNHYRGLWYYEVVRSCVPPKSGSFSVFGSAKRKRAAKRAAAKLAISMEERFPSHV